MKKTEFANQIHSEKFASSLLIYLSELHICNYRTSLNSSGLLEGDSIFLKTLTGKCLFMQKVPKDKVYGQAPLFLFRELKT